MIDKAAFGVTRELSRAFVRRCDLVYAHAGDSAIREHMVNFFIGASAAAQLTGNHRLCDALTRFINFYLTAPNSLTVVRHFALLGTLDQVGFAKPKGTVLDDPA